MSGQQQAQQPSVMPIHGQYYPQTSSASLMPAPLQQQPSQIDQQLITTPSPLPSPSPAAYMMPPMPTMSPMPQMPMNNQYMNTLVMNNAMSSMNSNDSSSKSPIVDMVFDNFKDENDVFTQVDRQKLAADLSLIERLNLVDDEDRIYTLYTHLPHMNYNTNYLFTTLAQIYREKYNNLYIKYPSLTVYVEFCLGFLIYHTAQKLIDACTSSRTMALPCSANSSSLIQHRRRKYAIKRPNQTTKPTSPLKNGSSGDDAPTTSKNNDANDADDNKSNDNDAPPVKKIKMLKPIHPFFESSLYKSHESIFHIGRFIRYLIPADFAPLYTSYQRGQWPRWETTGSVKTSGIRVVFNRPVVTLLGRCPQSVKFVLTACQHFERIRDTLEQMSGYKSEQDLVRYGCKKNLQTIMIKQNSVKTGALHESGFNITIMSNFTVHVRGNNLMTARGYTDNVYNLSNTEITESDAVNAEAKRMEMVGSIKRSLAKFDYAEYAYMYGHNDEIKENINFNCEEDIKRAESTRQFDEPQKLEDVNDDDDNATTTTTAAAVAADANADDTDDNKCSE